MKLEARQLPGFLRDPGDCRLVLLYGDDPGLIRERADALTRVVAGALDDPFRVAELDRDSEDRLLEEAMAGSLTGGRRVVRVREIGEAALARVRRAFDVRGNALIILEAPELGRGKLRSFVETAQAAVAIGCYAEEGRALEATIRGLLGEQGVAIEAAALAWLAARLNPDRASIRAEVEKLALFAGAAGRIDLDMVEAVAADVAAGVIEDAVLAAVSGDVATADRALDRAIEEGASPIAVLRTAATQIQRLHQARLFIAAGATAAEVVRMLRPPVFFKQVPRFTRALRAWTTDDLLDAIEQARRTELACKATGARSAALCRRFLLVLALRAARNEGSEAARARVGGT